MTIRRYLVAPPAGSGGGEGGAVDSVNGQTGAVTLAALDVGAQAADTDLTTIAGLTHANDTILQTKSGAWAARTPAQVKADLALAKGDVGLGSVDNTADTAKPISNDTQAALTGKAPAAPNPPSGYYFYTAAQFTIKTSNTLAVGTLRLAPWVVDRQLAVSRLFAEVTTVGEAGSKFRIGIYADDGNCRPGALVADAGQINGDSATVQELTVSLTLEPGLYWVGGVVQAVTTTQPTMKTIPDGWEPPIRVPASSNTTLATTNGSVFGLNMTGVTGALPGTFTSTGSTTNIPRIGARAG